jgi:hypothetical protein
MQEFQDLSQPQNHDLHFDYPRLSRGKNGFPCTTIISPSKESGESHGVNQKKIINSSIYTKKLFSKIYILHSVLLVALLLYSKC